MHIYSPPCIQLLKKILENIFPVEDSWCAQTCLFRADFGLPIRTLTLAVSARSVPTCGIFFLYILGPKLYCSGIFFKSLSYLYEVVRTNFSADFWTFRNF